MLITLPKSPPLACHPSHQGPLTSQGVQSAEQGVGLSEPRRQSGKSTPTTVATMVLALCRKTNSWILRIITGTFPTIPSLHCASLWRAQAPTHPFQLKEPLPSQSSPPPVLCQALQAPWVCRDQCTSTSKRPSNWSAGGSV